MTMIKKKSLIVALISSFVICLVLIVNLIGYLIYTQLKHDELNSAYKASLQRVNAKMYAEHIEIDKLGATFDRVGPLSGQAVLEGIIRNDGVRDLSDICVRVRFLDNDGASLYEITFHPQEPSLGAFRSVQQASATHITDADAYPSSIKPESSLPFKKILANCPNEIITELKHGAPSLSGKNKWTGKFDYEILAVTFR